MTWFVYRKCENFLQVLAEKHWMLCKYRRSVRNMSRKKFSLNFQSPYTIYFNAAFNTTYILQHQWCRMVQKCYGKERTSNNFSPSLLSIKLWATNFPFNIATQRVYTYSHTSTYITLITYWHSTSSKIYDKKGVKYIKSTFMLC